MRPGRLIVLLALALPSLALAHAGQYPVGGFMQGLAHPVSGLDHMLAMVAVGLIAGRLGGAALWQVPASFVAMMACGTLIGMAGVPVAFVEAGIAASVVAFGVLLAVARAPTATVTVLLVGAFALFHGHAHGTEAAKDVAGFAYGLGLMTSSAALHATGAMVGMLLTQRLCGRQMLRAGGGMIAAAGVYLFS